MKEIIKELLKKRNITTVQDIEDFFSPSPKKTYDPFLMKGMKEAIEKIETHMEKNNKICIYGDYDADGVTSVCILKEAMDSVSPHIYYYIPSRFQEGYGLNENVIRELSDSGFNLIITVDCGIVSFREVALAKELGMEVIVTDHHAVGENIPSCIVLNPHQKDCSYPFKELAGCGVAYKLLQGLVRKEIISKEFLRYTLDLVALGTVGDAVPLLDENRTLVKYGIKEMVKGRRTGLQKLLDKVTPDEEILKGEDIGYRVVPNINAAGRLFKAEAAVEMFLEHDEERAACHVDNLISINQRRKDIQKTVYEQCMIEIKENLSQEKFPVIVGKNLHEGVIGIVAGKICEQINRPVLVLSEKDGVLKGSCRTRGKINVYEVLSCGKDIFEKFGGHEAACGLTIKKTNLNELKSRIRKQMTSYSDEDYKDEILPDMIIDLQEIDLELAKEIEAFEPFGKSNEKPLFRIDNCSAQNITELGEGNKHYKFSLKLPDGKEISCIKFNADVRGKDIFLSESDFSILGHIDINRWKGRENIQIVIEGVDYVQ